MADETLNVRITADDKASGVINGLRGTLGDLGSFAGTAIKVGAGVALGGLVALGAGLGASVKQAADAQKGQALLASVIKSTGGVAGVTADMANEYASSLQNVTVYEDDAVLSAENLLLTFTSIKKEIFPQVTELALDMSTAFGQDLKSSAIQLGKALQDPIQGVSALARVGVSFTDQQKEQIKVLVESGKQLEAQKLVMAELEKQVGGAARAMGSTFTGQIQIIQNKIGDAMETIGGAFLPVLQKAASGLVSFLTAPEVQGAIEGFAQGLAGLATMVGEGLAQGGSALKAWWDANGPGILDAATRVGKDLQAWWDANGPGITASATRVGENIKSWWDTNGPSLLDGSNENLQNFQKGLDLVFKPPVSLQNGELKKAVDEALAELAAAMKRHQPELESASSNLVSAFNKVQYVVSSAFDHQALDDFNNSLNHIKFNLPSLGQVFDQFIAGWAESQNQLAGLLDWLADRLGEILGIINAILEGMAKIFGGGGSTPDFTLPPIGSRALGGPLRRGELSWVGEDGPELFMPDRSGVIIPNHLLGAAGGMMLQLVYAPQISTLDQYEMESRLRPAVEEIMRSYK